MSETASVSAVKSFRIPLMELAGDQSQYRWIRERMEVVIFHWQGQYRAFSSICPHMGAQLCLDTRREALFCPWHGLASNLNTGETGHHRYRRLKEFPCKVEGTDLVIALGGEE